LLAAGLALGALSAATPALAAGRAVSAATPAEKAGAQEAYLAAMEHYQAKRFEPALEGFRASYDIVASPNSHMMIVNVLVDLGRRAEAFEEAELVAIEAEALGRSYATTAKAARDMATDLRAKLGHVTIELAPGTELRSLRVGGRAVLEARWARPIVADPGQVEVVAETSRGNEKQAAAVVAGGVVAMKVGAATAAPVAAVASGEPGEVSSGSGPSSREPFFKDKRRIAGVAVAGVGAVGLVSFAVLGSINNSKYSELQDRCPNGICPSDASEDIASGESTQTAANVMLALGVIGVAAGAGLITWSYVDKHGSEGSAQVTLGRESEPPPTARHVRLRVGPGAVGVEGAF
jgi:hypothetical protein